MERAKTENRYKWDLTALFPSDESWEAELKSLKTSENLEKYKGKLGNKEDLLAYFTERDAFLMRAEKLYVYASMKHDEDVREEKYISFRAKAEALFIEFSENTCFFEPELSALPEEKLKEYSSDGAFSAYDYTLDRILREKPHVLSEGEEKILALAADPLRGFRNVFSMLDNADLPLGKAHLDGEEVDLTHGLYGLIMRGENRKERKEAFEEYYRAYGSLINVLSSVYEGNVKKNVFYKTVRKYPSCLAMALSGEDVPSIVYENLLSSVEESLPVLHRYIRLRKDILGLDEQHMYDISVPLVKNADFSLDYDEAYQTVIDGLAPLGKEYQALLKQAHDERWLDVCENEGKRSGAYSTGAYGVHPYVLLNYQKTTSDVFTIAHEMGHSIHTYRSNEAQPYEKSSYTIFLAEIASTVNEVLLLKYLYRTTKDIRLKKFLLNYYIDMFRTTLFRQTQFAEFEAKAHAHVEDGQALTKEFLCNLYKGLNEKYYGDGIIHDEQIALEWARIPHFYSAFYVYKYATGIVSAVSIVKRILTEGQRAIDEYFEFLSSGGKTAPVDILKLAGVDLTTKTPFEIAMSEFEETLNEFTKLNERT